MRKLKTTKIRGYLEIWRLYIMSGLFNKKILQQRIKNYTIENIEKK